MGNMKTALCICVLSVVFACILFLPQIEEDVEQKTTVNAVTEEEVIETLYVSNAEDPNESENIEAALLARCNRIDDVICTFYWVGSCGKSVDNPSYGITASGRIAQPYHTVAVDPKVIPLGSQVIVDYGDGVLYYYIAEDTGSAIKGNHIDVCLENEADCFEAGVKRVTVYWIKED